MSEASFVYITTSSPEEAEKIGAALVEARLAACANLLPGITSMYWSCSNRIRSAVVLAESGRKALARTRVCRRDQIAGADASLASRTSGEGLESSLEEPTGRMANLVHGSCVAVLEQRIPPEGRRQVAARKTWSVAGESSTN